MPRVEIKIKRDNNIFAIQRDKNFEHMLGLSLVFYQRIMSLMQKSEGLVLQMNPKFMNLVTKLNNYDSDALYLSQDEIVLFVDWIDCLCLIMLDLDSVDFKNKDIKKYLTLSERFIQKSKELIGS